MRIVTWSAKAERQLSAWIDYLEEAAGPELAARAYEETRAKAASLGGFSGHRRSARWQGYQEVGLGSWRKLLVYRVVGNQVRVSALFDMRQDLTRVHPESE